MKRFSKNLSVRRLRIPISSVGTAATFSTLSLSGGEIYGKRPPPPRWCGRTRRATTPVKISRWGSRSGSRSEGCSKGRSGPRRVSVLHGCGLAAPGSVGAFGDFGGRALRQRDARKRKTPCGKAALSTEKVSARTHNDPASGVITVSDNRARAIEQVEKHFSALYEGSGEDALKLRRRSTPSPPRPSTRRCTTSTFYFWTKSGATTQLAPATMSCTPAIGRTNCCGQFGRPPPLRCGRLSRLLLLAGIGVSLQSTLKEYRPLA